MISVETLFRIVNNDLATKGKGGYASNDEFNRTVNMGQNILVEYYCDRIDGGLLNDALRPFIKTASLLLDSANECDPPSDLQHLLEGGVLVTDGGTTTQHAAPYLRPDEILNHINNEIRKPSVAKKRFYHSLESKLRFFSDAPVAGYIRYVSTPTAASRAVTLDTVNQEEVYDAANTVNLSWPDTELTNFVDIMLAFKGVQIRETELMSFVQAKKQIFA